MQLERWQLWLIAIGLGLLVADYGILHSRLNGLESEVRELRGNVNDLRIKEFWRH